MAFDIVITPTEFGNSIQLIDLDSKTEIEILSKGAILNHWTIPFQEKKLELIQGNDLSMGWHHFEENGFRGAKMNPFAGRLEAGTYEWEGKTYTFEKFYLGKHALHGIQYNADFTIHATNMNAQNAAIVLEHTYEGTDAGFPFPYRLSIKWQLEKNNQLSVTTNLINLHDAAIPMMDGWHPYFQLDTSIEACTLTFKASKEIEFDNSLLPNRQLKNIDQFEKGYLIKKEHLDRCFLLDTLENEIRLASSNLTLLIRPEKNYPYVQVYTPADRKSIAIENLSGVPNCFNNKMGLQILEPHQSISYTTHFQVIPK